MNNIIDICTNTNTNLIILLILKHIKDIHSIKCDICEDCEGTLDHVGTYNNNKDIWLICLDCKREYAYNPITQKWSYLF